MPCQKIKFIISQDGTVTEEVQGAVSKECLDVTLPFEQALGAVNSREYKPCLLYTSPSPRDRQKSRMPSSA